MTRPLKDFFTIKFKARGRDWNGCDCWGFARLVAVEHFGKEVPALDENYSRIENSEELEGLVSKHKALFQECLNQPGALVLLRRSGFDCHVGIMVSDHEFLHIEKGIGVNKQSINHSHWSDKLLGFYEYRAG